MKTISNLFAMIFLCLFAISCSSNPGIVNYDKTNPIKIEEATAGLDLKNLLNNVSHRGTIAIRSIEKYPDPNLDEGVVYMIEDQLVSNLIENGYRVVERDPNVFPSILSESLDKYTFKNPSFNYNNNQELLISTSVDASDFILTYRVLECGVVYNEVKNTEKVERSARTRLHCRLTNTRTSEIFASGVVENEISDLIRSQDIEDLEKVSYNYYHHTLPLQDSNYDSKEIKILGPKEEWSEKPKTSSKWVPALFGVAILGLMQN